MNRLLAALSLALLGLASMQALAHDRIDTRQQQQQARIAQGVGSDDLTRSERRGLAQQQRRIARTEQRLRRDGLASGERLRLEALQDRASRQIARQRHDRQRRSGTRFGCR